MAAAGTPLMTVMDLSRVTARAHIPQNDAAVLKVGDKATIAVSGLEEPVEGKVILVSPALDPNSTTVEVWVQAKNPKQTLKPGSSVRLSMISVEVPDALVIPAAALLTGADGASTVMVIGDDQHAHQQAVKVGIRQDDKIQITEGLRKASASLPKAPTDCRTTRKFPSKRPCRQKKKARNPVRERARLQRLHQR